MESSGLTVLLTAGTNVHFVHALLDARLAKKPKDVEAIWMRVLIISSSSTVLAGLVAANGIRMQKMFFKKPDLSLIQSALVGSIGMIGFTSVSYRQEEAIFKASKKEEKEYLRRCRLPYSRWL